MRDKHYPLNGTGLGLRRDMLDEVENQPSLPIHFMEVAPENWIHVGGHLGQRFKSLTEQYPFVCHGLSLSLGGPAPLDEKLLYDIKHFLDEHQVRCYSEHLSYCSDAGHLYDLMPIPFTEEAVRYVAQRITHTQNLLERRIAVENVSYYAAPGKEMDEIEFINAVLKEADCDLLLDVNNIYVNSINHRYDAEESSKALPGERIAYIHIAGHFQQEADLIVDTHGADVIDPVWELLNKAYAHFGVIPTLLERDFNIPPLDELLDEINTIQRYQKQWTSDENRIAHG